MTNVDSNPMLARGSKGLLLGFAVCLAAWPASLAAQGLRSAPLHEFAKTGPTREVVRGLIQYLNVHGVFRGVIGFESLEGPGAVVSLSVTEANLGDALRTICDQDLAYRLVDTDSPYLIDILPADSGAHGHEVLEFRIPKLDLELDERPQSLIQDLPDHSPALAAYLRSVYLKGGGTDLYSMPGAGFFGDAKLPHFTIHLSDVSVREALNAVALQSFQMYQAIGIDPRWIHTSDQLRVAPTGWEYRFVSPRGVSFYVWLHQLFRPL